MKVSVEHQNYIKKLKREKHKITLTRILILISIFVLWEIAGDLNIIDPFLTSTPSRMLQSLIKIYGEGALFTHIGITCF